MNWIFDQDCLSDINSNIAYYDWFIFRLQTAQMTTAYVNSLPEMAVTFGDAGGNTYAYAMALD